MTVISCVPCDRDDDVKLAVPPLNVTVISVALLSLKTTEPVGPAAAGRLSLDRCGEGNSLAQHGRVDGGRNRCYCRIPLYTLG